MSTFFHVAPATALDAILSDGIVPASQRYEYRRNEDQAIQDWLVRWADRMGRDIEEIDHLVPVAHYDIHRVCLFADLATARAWAAADTAEMIVLEIDGEYVEAEQDQFAADEGEEGAICTRDTITPDMIKVLA